MKKRLLALLILSSMIISAAACGSDSTPADDTSADTTTEAPVTDDGKIDSGVGDTDFNRTFKIYTSGFYDCSQWIYSEDNNGEIMALELFKGRSHTEEKLGVDIEIVVGDSSYTVVRDTFHNMMLSGETEYQMLYNHDTATSTNAMNGDFLNIRKFEDYIDMEKPWWRGASEQFTIDGKLLFTSTCLDLSSIFLNYLLVYNKTLAEDNGIVIPYDKVIAGEWYMDDLIALTDGLSQDKTGDTVIDEKDQFGIATSKYPMMGLQSNLGGGMLINNDGVIELNTNIERMVGILEKWEKLMENGTHKYGASNGGGEELFINNQTVFMLGEARNLYNTVRQSDVVYGILPVPKYDATQEDYASAGCALYWGVGITTPDEDLEFVSSVIQELSCYNYNYTVPAVWETILGAKLSDSPEDAAMFEIIRGAQYVDLGFAFSLQSWGLEATVFMLENTTSDKVVSYFESCRNSAQTAADGLNTTFEGLQE